MHSHPCFKCGAKNNFSGHGLYWHRPLPPPHIQSHGLWTFSFISELTKHLYRLGPGPLDNLCEPPPPSAYLNRVPFSSVHAWYERSDGPRALTANPDRGPLLCLLSFLSRPSPRHKVMTLNCICILKQKPAASVLCLLKGNWGGGRSLCGEDRQTLVQWAGDSGNDFPFSGGKCVSCIFHPPPLQNRVHLLSMNQAELL